MPRLALINILVGFAVVFVSAAGGAFIAWDMSQGFVSEPAILNSWYLTLARSSHGHFNLFGYLHILFGLTLSYSSLSQKLKVWQSMGLVLGTLAMGPGMLMRAYGQPSVDVSVSATLVGLMLSLALASIGAHIVGLGLKLAKRS